MDDVQQEVPLKEADPPQQLDNPVYGTEEDVVAKDAAVEPTEQATYSTVGAKNPEEHEFDNPIYGDEITSNVYSHTTHNGSSHGQQPQANANVTLDDTTYSHMTASNEEANTQGHLYSHTSHHPGAVEQPRASPGAEYDTIEVAGSTPHYEAPSTASPRVDIGSHYEQADLEPTAIYSELEEPEYSSLENH